VEYTRLQEVTKLITRTISKGVNWNITCETLENSGTGGKEGEFKVQIPLPVL
jgi:hypothetical protein